MDDNTMQGSGMGDMNNNDPDKKMTEDMDGEGTTEPMSTGDETEEEDGNEA